MHVVYVLSNLERSDAITSALGERVAIHRNERLNRVETQAVEYSDLRRSFLISLACAGHTIQFVTELTFSDIALLLGNDTAALRFQAALL